MNWIFDILSPKEAAYFMGIVWGIKDSLGFWEYEKMKVVGLAHVVVASGANIYLISNGVVEGLAWLIGRKKAIIFGLLVSCWYAIQTGFNPPIIRAVLLFGVRCGAELLGRQFVWSRALILVIIISYLADRGLFESVSFWLSVTAYMGMATATNARGLIWDFRRGIWISLWLLPFLSLAFGKFSLIGPVVGVIVLPLVEMIIGLGMIASFMHVIFPILGEKIVWLAKWPIDCLIYLSDGFIRLPMAQIDLDFPIWLVPMWYAVLIWLAGIIWNGKTRKEGH